MRPTRVQLRVDVDPTAGSGFRGEVAIHLRLARATRRIRLHAAGLRIAKPRLERRGRVLDATLTAHLRHEMIELRLPESVPRGDAVLRMAFAGKLRSDLCGLYAARVGERRYAFTQLEATDARKFFPCFDEPAMKSRFQISVTTGVANTVLSNAPAERTERLARGRKTVHFAETPPLSTYLVALAVGELEASRATRVGRTPIRVWHTPGKSGLTAFGLEAARECLGRLERYFDLPYPYAKLDLVAVPDFEFGAMENAGAVFFRETLLLLDPATATLAEKKRAAEVICHELAHMWYGNLVTMAWWDDLWLNEAFATWMAFAIVDDWKPAWKMWQDFQHGRAAALELDALRHTHPIYCDVRTPAEANENFDLITYEKGAAVVRMIERFLGPGRFRAGVRRYIRRHREGNAVAADLWRALAEASGQPVERLARAWIEREGYPLVTLERSRARGGHELRIRQERFVERRRRRSGGERAWPIPFVARVGTGRGSRLERRLLTRARERIDLGRRPIHYIYGNADEGGFFRPLHAAADWPALLSSLDSLSAVERMGLVDHQWALVRAGRAQLGTALQLAAALRHAAEPDVLLALRKPLAFVGASLVPDAAPELEPRYRAWVRETFEERFAELGWQTSPRESEARSALRGVLLGIVGGIGAAPGVVAEAQRCCDRYLRDRRAVPADLADGVVTLAARVGGARRHRQFVAAMAKAKTPQEQRRFLLALAEFRDPQLVDRTLALSLTDSVPTQDVIFLLARLLANPTARSRSWSFIQRRWPRLRRRMPSLLASRLIESTSELLTAEHRREVAVFFRAHPVPSGKRALRQALERFDWYRSFRGRAARDLAKFLAD